MSRTRIALLRPFVVASLLCAIYGCAVVVVRGDPYALVTLGMNYAPAELSRHIYSAEGYDGQFTYYLARYGLGAEPYLDVPSYRAQRILLSGIGGLFPHDQLTIALFIINLLALGVSVALLEKLLTQYNISRWYALGYGLSLGVLGAARLNTTETLAYAFVLAALVLIMAKRWLWGASCFALAAITKETTLLFPATYSLWLFGQKEWRKAFLFGSISLSLFALWQGVLLASYGAIGVGSGGNLATSFEIIPLMGFLRILQDGGLTIFIIYTLVVGPFVILPTLWGLWRGGQALIRNRWTPELCLLFTHALVLLFVPFSTYRELLGIFRFVVGLQIALILYAARIRHQRALRYSTLYALTSIFVIASDFSMS